MDNHKPITIPTNSLFCIFQSMIKTIMHEDFLDFGCMNTNKNIFLYFLNKEFFSFFSKILKKTQVYLISDQYLTM
jgi:hypothetical protein